MAVTSQPGRLWRHHRCACLDDVGFCITGLFSPCHVMGEIAQELGKNRISWCFAGMIPGLSVVSLAHLRTDMRHKLGISGSALDDICASCCCPFCTLMQMGQEAKDVRQIRLGTKPTGSWRTDNKFHGVVVSGPKASDQSSTDPVGYFSDNNNKISVRF